MSGTTVTSTSDLTPAGVLGYAKLIAAFLSGLLTVLVPFLPTDPQDDKYIQAAVAVLGFIAVYAIPNRVVPVVVIPPGQPIPANDPVPPPV